MRIRSIAVLLGVVIALGLAAPAFAATVYYGSQSSPIKAESNSSDGNAWFYGNVTVKDHTWLRNQYTYRDSAPGGNAAYAQTDWYFWYPCSENSCYRYAEEDRSSDTTSGDWRTETDYVDLASGSNQGRANTKVCENQNNSPDACSKTVVATLTY